MKTFFKYLPAGLALLAMQSAIAGSTSTPETAFTQQAELSRAEVQADLAIWKRAGMDKFWRGNQTPDTFSREYRMAQAEYQRMRSGTEYQQELQRRRQ